MWNIGFCYQKQKTRTTTNYPHLPTPPPPKKNKNKKKQKRKDIKPKQGQQQIDTIDQFQACSCSFSMNQNNSLGKLYMLSNIRFTVCDANQHVWLSFVVALYLKKKSSSKVLLEIWKLQRHTSWKLENPVSFHSVCLIIKMTAMKPHTQPCAPAHSHTHTHTHTHIHTHTYTHTHTHTHTELITNLFTTVSKHVHIVFFFVSLFFSFFNFHAKIVSFNQWKDKAALKHKFQLYLKYVLFHWHLPKESV